MVPAAALSQEPSATPSVVVVVGVVLVNIFPEGVVTVQLTELPAAGGVTEVDRVTLATLPLPIHPVTAAVGVPIAGQVVQPGKAITAVVSWSMQFGDVRVTVAPPEALAIGKVCAT